MSLRGCLCLCFVLLVPALAQSQSPLSLQEQIRDTALDWDYLGVGIESRCGSDWFAVRLPRWECLKRTPSGVIEVASFGSLPATPTNFVVLRGPVPGDRKLLVAESGGPFPGGNHVKSFDPVTLDMQELGQLPELGFIDFQPLMADANGDGFPELLLRGWGQTPNRLVTLPGGPIAAFQVLRDVSVNAQFVGQFDNDPQEELGLVEFDGALKIYDASTGALEPYSPVGSFSIFGSRSVVVVDWDADGVDEVAIQSASGAVALVDPNDAAPPRLVSMPGAALGFPLTAINWQVSSSADLAVWSFLGMVIVDPRTAGVIADFPHTEVQNTLPGEAVAADWDGDGDIDLAYIVTDPAKSLHLVRNGSGTSTLQYAALAKQVVGSLTAGGQAQLVSVEHFSGPLNANVRMRRRDGQSLALLGDVPVASASIGVNTYAVADLDPAAGTEFLETSSSEIRLYDMAGALLWSSPISNPMARQFRAAIPADDSCVGTACARVLVLDESQSNQTDGRLVLLDGASGSELWSQSLAGVSLPSILAHTDLNGDGTPELIYSNLQPSGSYDLLALDGVTHDLLWAHSTNTRIHKVARTRDSALRLAILNEYGTMDYRSPLDGTLLRQATLPTPGGASCGHGCDFAYLSDGDTVGRWVVIGFGDVPLRVLTRDIRGPIWERNGVSPVGLATIDPGRVYIASENAILMLEGAADGVFVEEFEGW